MTDFTFDEIGYWSELKLEIIQKYAAAYSTIMVAQRRGRIPSLRHLYIDGFAGAGVHISRTSRDFVPGSPMNALLVEPPFTEFHLIDLDTGKAANLREIAAARLNRDVFVYDGDCNSVLLEEVFPCIRYQDYKRALCILDPYGLHLDWKVIEKAGRMKTIDLFLNFPILDMNRNALWRDASRVTALQANRLTRFWGDESWKTAAYRTEENLFGPEEVKGTNEDVEEAFRARLKEVAGFANVIRPLPMRNDQGGIVYYLFFASPNATGNKIANQIFGRYRSRGEKHG